MNMNKLRTTVVLDDYIQRYPRKPIEQFRNNSSYTVYESDDGPDMKRKLYTIQESSDDDSFFGILFPDEPSFKIIINEPQNIESRMSDLGAILGPQVYQMSEIINSYERHLSFDEGNVHKFVNQISEEIEELGYDVSTERSSGTWVQPAENKTKTEYKWWFYIYETEDWDKIAPHNFDLYFEEDGIYLRGHVTEGETHDNEFRKLMDEFSPTD